MSYNLQNHDLLLIFFFFMYQYGDSAPEALLRVQALKTFHEGVMTANGKLSEQHFLSRPQHFQEFASRDS